MKWIPDRQNKLLEDFIAANTHGIQTQHVKAAIQDSDFYLGSRPPRIRALAIGAAAGLAVGILFGAGVTWMVMSGGPAAARGAASVGAHPAQAAAARMPP